MPISCPKISIVTPSYNQAAFIADTIQSVISNQYRNLEYIVMDGGSTDESAEIIKRYQGSLAYWTSEADGGQYDAINKGFARTTGEIMGWLNSDDKFTPWALSVVAEIFSQYPQVEWLSTAYPLEWNKHGQAIACRYRGGFDRDSFFKGAYLDGARWYSRGWLQQESTFWRRSLWDRAGGYVESSLQLGGDFELWARFFKHAKLFSVAAPLGGFRRHDAQKTGTRMEEYRKEAEAIFLRYGGCPYGSAESFVRRGAHYLVGQRSLMRLPRFLGKLLILARMINEVDVFRWTGQSWELSYDYVV